MAANRNFSAEDLTEHRRYLYRYAIAQLREPDAAEEAVQDTLLAALEAAASFAGKSSLRTWLTAILKHKIIDQKRRQARSPVVLAQGEDDASQDELLDALFDAAGEWREAPPAWTNPEKSLENRHFWQAFDWCMDHLPGTTARCFFLREIHGLDTDDICKELDISASNCWVMLYRARMSLRLCLEQRWFLNAKE
jgi:RNA polymerase sigma-70 factor (ECF subfamily)